MNDHHQLPVDTGALGSCREDDIEATRAPMPAAPTTPRLITADQVAPQRITWLLPDRVPEGMLTILEGPPKSMKSLFAVDLVARIRAMVKSCV